MEIITPSDYVGTIMELSQQRRGDFEDMQYLTEARTTLVYNLPLAEVRPAEYTVAPSMHTDVLLQGGDFSSLLYAS